MAGLCSLRDLTRAGVLSHVVLQARLARHAGASTSSVRRDLAASGFKKEMILHNAGALRRIVTRLQPRRERSEWSDYTRTRGYDAADLAAKRALVKRALVASAAKRVWDLGCNTGELSLLAAETADHVVAMDGDELAIDRLYEKLAAEGNSKILPLVVRLDDPSPALGWRNRERRTIADRGAPDLVLALALAHHLVITNNIPVASLLAWLAGLGDFLVVEFVSKQDPMVEKLLLNKIDNYDDWERAAFETELEARFDVLERLALESGTRFLYFARSRHSPS
jgi:SAM-dependent methyltransferase